MLVMVVETPAYISKAAKVLGADEAAAVIDLVARNPADGDVIPVTHGLRKMRIPLAGRGKRGGGRIIYWFYNLGYPAVLLWIFAKNERADLTHTQRAILVKACEHLRDEFRS